MKEPLTTEKRVCPACGKTAEPYCDLPECGLAGEHDVIDRIVERNRLLMDVVLKDDKPLEERREALERVLSVDPFR